MTEPESSDRYYVRITPFNASKVSKLTGIPRDRLLRAFWTAKNEGKKVRILIDKNRVQEDGDNPAQP